MSWLSPALLKSTLNSIENVLEKVDSTAASTLGKSENHENSVPNSSEESAEFTTTKLTKQTSFTSPQKQASATKSANDQDIFQFLNTPIQEQRTKRQATRKNSKQNQITSVGASAPIPTEVSISSQQNTATVSNVEIIPPVETVLSAIATESKEQDETTTSEQNLQPIVHTNEQMVALQEGTSSAEDENKQSLSKTAIEQIPAQSTEHSEADTNDPDDKYQEVLDQNADLLLENKLLRDEIVSLNKEVLSLAARLKQTQQELENISLKHQENQKSLSEKDKVLSKMRRTEEELHNAISSKTSQLHALNVKLEEALQEIKLKDNKIDSINQRISKLSDEKNHSTEEYRQNIDVLNSKIHDVEKELQTREQLVIELKQSLQQREATWQSSLNDLSNAVAANQRIIEEKNAEIIRYQNQLKEHIDTSKTLRQELQEYKSRATKVLQEKEKSIKELNDRLSLKEDAASPKSVQNPPNSDPEKEFIKSELDRTIQELGASKEAIAELEQQHAQQMADNEKQIRDLETQLSREAKRVQNLQLDLVHKSQELNLLRDQISNLTEQSNLSLKLKEEEVQKLKRQMSMKTSSSTQEELENRLQTVTEHLIQKQNQLEAITSEKAYLQMQLEIAVQNQQKFKERDSLLADVVDDEAPPLLPSGTPSKYGRRHSSLDHGMRLRPMSSLVENSSLIVQHPENAIARQVIGAANFLDAISGFLINGVRRSPLLRLGTLCYLMLLHLYFFWIFYTWEPEIHGQK